MEVNGYFTQMPMTFYTQKGEWDLPPGFEAGFNSRFSRKIGIECMSCHNSLPDFVKGSENKFNSVPNGIGCERCHGPGEVHVNEKTAGIVVDTSKEIDYSIVNPAKLPIGLQFDVCQRCHLQGNAVLKEGKSFCDFHPGMKLSDIETIFLPKYEGAEDEFIMASHADRLKKSKCFLTPTLKSENTLKPYKNGLTCVTCHNPHVSVKVTGKEVFNNACKNCHSTPSSQGEGRTSCSEKREVRNKVQDNCVSCHMPKSGAIDIPHVSITDHFIRKPTKKVDVVGVKKFMGLFAINEINPEPKVKAQAYLNQFEKFDHNPALLDSAKKYLDTKSGYDYNLMIRYYFIKNDFQKIVSEGGRDSRVPDKSENAAWTSYYIAEAYSQLGDNRTASFYYKQASAQAPYNLDFLNKLAGNIFSQNKMDEAKAIYERIISENPKFAPAYCNLGYIYFMQQDLEKAEVNYNKSLALDPDYEIALMNKVQLFVAEKKNDKAKIILENMIKHNPMNDKAKTILQKIKTMNS
jgi:TolA-binding protein